MDGKAEQLYGWYGRHHLPWEMDPSNHVITNKTMDFDMFFVDHKRHYWQMNRLKIQQSGMKKRKLKQETSHLLPQLETNFSGYYYCCFLFFSTKTNIVY